MSYGIPSNIGFDVAIVGLGVGSIASYAKKGQHFTFYEIDPGVEQIARDRRYFNFLANMQGSFDIIIGDGRLKIADAPHNLFGMIILDAFSSDAIPVHLLTKEALKLYLAKLKEDGIIVFHISNRFWGILPGN
jgi:spermidine synthase